MANIQVAVAGRDIKVFDGYEKPSAGDVNTCSVAFDLSGVIADLPHKRVTFSSRSAVVTVDYADELQIPQECMRGAGALYLTVTGYNSEDVEVARTHRMTYPIEIAAAGDDEGTSPSAATLDVVSRIDALAETLAKSETERQSTFESNEAARQSAFDSVEATRQATFSTAETIRQTTFASKLTSWTNDVSAQVDAAKSAVDAADKATAEADAALISAKQATDSASTAAQDADLATTNAKQATQDAQAATKTATEEEAKRATAELARVTAETERVNAELAREEAESKRAIDTQEAVTKADTATFNAKAATANANTAATAATNAASDIASRVKAGEFNGAPFSVTYTPASIADMEAITTAKQGEFACILSDVEDPDNSKLYMYGDGKWNYITDMSGATGLQGPQGVQGVSFVSSSVDGTKVYVTRYDPATKQTTTTEIGDFAVPIEAAVDSYVDSKFVVVDAMPTEPVDGLIYMVRE